MERVPWQVWALGALTSVVLALAGAWALSVNTLLMSHDRLLAARGERITALEGAVRVLESRMLSDHAELERRIEEILTRVREHAQQAPGRR